jgi:hypothetical protein
MRSRLAIGPIVRSPPRPDTLEMPQPEHEPPAATQPPRVDGEVVAAAVALLEAAALTAAMRRVASWNPHLHLSAAADRLWAPSASTDQESWRTDPSKHATQFRLAVLVAEATIGRCLAEDGYLSARQLSVDLRQAAAWLAAGARFGGWCRGVQPLPCCPLLAPPPRRQARRYRMGIAPTLWASRLATM